MGTVEGDPDLAAVRAYELTATEEPSVARLPWIDRGVGAEVIREVRRRYRDDPAFQVYQGPTATVADLQSAADSGAVWFGSHLYHHWDLRVAGDDVYEESLALNAEKLGEYRNALSAFATPHGYAGGNGRDLVPVAQRQGVRVLFTARGTQNSDADRTIIDRVVLPPGSSNWRHWWHATHLARAGGFERGAADVY
jgi:hypothetical protein